MLAGRYVIGNILGQGGFGITYLAWDLDLDCKLAIKEYFPIANATRASDGRTVVPTHAKKQELFRYGLKKFVEEGRMLARFRDHPNIVSVVNFLKANGSGYIVMHYVEGITLKEYMEHEGGRLPFQAAVNILVPVMDALRAVHGANLLHRDISPDNVYINSSSQVQLLDFGATRHALGEHSQTLQSILKPGYAPEEQYRSRGSQGPWTDVYELGATLYHVLTGRVPPEALDRLAYDTLEPPSRLGVEIPRAAEVALLKALAVRAPERFQSMASFQQALLQGADSTEPAPIPRPRREKTNGRRSKQALFAVSAALVLLLSVALAIVWMRSRPSQNSEEVHSAVKAPLVPDELGKPATVPAPLRIVRFAVDRPQVAAGQQATLHWEVSGDPTDISITPDVGLIKTLAGSRQVAPKETATYVLIAKGPGGTVRSPVTVTVDSRQAALTTPIAPVISEFAAEPVNIKPGQDVRLQWSIEGEASDVWLAPGGAVPRSGKDFVVRPAGTTVYTLTARGASTIVEKSVKVEVTPYAAPAISQFSAEPKNVAPGKTARLTWITSGDISRITMTPGPPVNAGYNSLEVTPQKTTEYTLEVTGPGGTASKSVTIEIAKPAEATPALPSVSAANLVAEAKHAFAEAQSQLLAKNYDGAATLFGRAARLKPGWSEPLVERAKLDAKLGRFSETIEDCNEALRLNPSEAIALNLRGYARYSLNQAKDAVPDFDEAIRLKPDFLEAYNNRGNAKLQLKDRQSAEADFKIARSLQSVRKKR